jgi:hypothetical protein
MLIMSAIIQRSMVNFTPSLLLLKSPVPVLVEVVVNNNESYRHASAPVFRC